jgi:heme exporter protein B
LRTFGKALELAKKDLRIEFRTKNTINFMLLFALITSMMFSVAVPISIAEKVAPALMWLVFLFVGMLGYSRAFLREVELETLDALRISPISPSSVLMGKVIYNISLMLLMEVTILPIFLALFNLSIVDPLMLLVAVTAGNVGFVVVSSSLSVLVIKSKSRELLLPVIMFPVIFPIITSTINAVNAAMRGGDALPHLAIIGAFCVIMVTVSLLTFDYAFTE